MREETSTDEEFVYITFFSLNVIFLALGERLRLHGKDPRMGYVFAYFIEISERRYVNGMGRKYLVNDTG